MKRFAVLTSGGDAAGMNAAIRAVVRTGLDNGWQPYGVRGGYSGLIAGELLPLGPRDVGGIIQLGGTMLRSGRCQEFKTEAGRNQALGNLQQNEIEALVVIGGDGSQTGANLISQSGFPVVGIASTIDNDLCGSDITIGVDTALNVALESIDRLKVTALGSGFAPVFIGHRPNQGHSPNCDFTTTARRSLASHQGGEAATNRLLGQSPDEQVTPHGPTTSRTEHNQHEVRCGSRPAPGAVPGLLGFPEVVNGDLARLISRAHILQLTQTRAELHV